MMHCPITPSAPTFADEFDNFLIELQCDADDAEALVQIVLDTIGAHVARETKAGRFVGDDWRRARAALNSSADRLRNIVKVGKAFDDAWFPEGEGSSH